MRAIFVEAKDHRMPVIIVEKASQLKFVPGKGEARLFLPGAKYCHVTNLFLFYYFPPHNSHLRISGPLHHQLNYRVNWEHYARFYPF